MYYVIVPTSKDIEHHGVLGMKWGVRRYQNPDGSLTAAGRSRYGVRRDAEKTHEKKESLGSNYKKNSKTEHINTSAGKVTRTTHTIKNEAKPRNDNSIDQLIDENYIKEQINNMDIKDPKIAKEYVKEIAEEAKQYGFVEMGYGSEIENKIQKAAFEYAEMFSQGKTEKGEKYLYEELKDYPYELITTEEMIDNGEKYVGHVLRIYGNEVLYNMNFERDYEDDSYWVIKNKE